MKCPKCGHENPEGTLFCEECDWRTDQPFKMKFGVNTVYLAYIAVIFGIASVVTVFLKFGMFAVVFGAIGMAFGAYSQTAVRLSDMNEKVKMALVVVSSIGILSSIIGFIYGIYIVFV
ncbi:MAG: zinc ribbon domain-containing protein [Candidatus Methanomethylophilaceae archaeon]